MSTDRQPTDLEKYVERTQSGPCFVCAFLAGNPDYAHATVFEDADHVAFLDRWPTVPGKVLVAPRAHVEHVVRDLDEAAYSRLMLFVREIALAVERSAGRSARTCTRSAATTAMRICTGTSPPCRPAFPIVSSSSTP